MIKIASFLPNGDPAMGCLISLPVAETSLPKDGRRRAEAQRLVEGIPASLQTLAVRAVCEQLERYPKLSLPPSIAAEASGYMVARGWWSMDTLRRLEHSRILTLDLSAASATIDDAAARAIGKQLSLVSLDLCGSRALTDEGVGGLHGLVRLRSLNLSRCANLTDAGLSKLSHLNALEQLMLERRPR